MLALCWVQTLSASYWKERDVPAQLSSGLLFGLICVVGMLSAVELEPGVLIDARLAVVGMAALFGGPLVAGSALVVAALCRLWLGGQGMPAGVFNLVMAAGLGLAYRHAVQRGWLRMGLLQFFVFGFVIYAVGLVMFRGWQSMAGLTIDRFDGIVLLVMPAVGALLGLLLQDGGRRIATIRALSQSDARMRAIAEAIPDTLVVLDWEGRYLEIVSPERNPLYAGKPGMLGRRMHEVLPLHYADLLLAFVGRALNSSLPQTLEYTMQSDGRLRSFEGRAQKMDAPSGGRPSVVLVTRDITERRVAEEQIRTLALYDPLTHLPNRSFLLGRLPYARRESADQQRFAALLMIDLDDFRNINDVHGNPIGDRVLQQTAQRLRELVPPNATVARLSGDDFVILLEGLAPLETDAAADAARIAHKVLAALGQPFVVDTDNHASTASVGISLFRDLNEKDNPMRRADLALYAAKASGKNRVRIYDPVIEDAATARLALEAEIRHGLRHGEFVVHYQPQMDFRGATVGMEALVRWQHPMRGLLSPAEFIPVAERAGLMVELDTQVLGCACVQLAQWSTDAALGQLAISVNISAFQLSQPDFATEVLKIVAQTGADPHRLKLELTETALVNDMSLAILHMVTLKKHGIRFALDDFGTGYSSMSYLQRLPIDQLKIDQGFVRGLPLDGGSLAIVRAIVALADNFGFEVLAEGVENEAQRAMLQANGCTHFQGYLFARAMPPAELARGLQHGWASAVTTLH
ncbi:hypothetical protein BH10PSE18_BH10PSE18_11570 [soil metagenome]